MTAPPLVLDPRAPLPSAREFVDIHHHGHGRRLLYHHRGLFREWRGAAWPISDIEAVKARLWEFLETAQTQNGQPFQPNRNRVGDVLEALKATVNLPADIDMPAWLYGADTAPLPREIVACANGLLHLPSLSLEPPTPAYFNASALPFDYDPDALDPVNWLKFLEQIWANDPGSIAALQEFAGYLLTPDTSQQKIFALVGPKRSGKGTIARVFRALFGEANVAGPTLAGLSTNFGLAPLIDRHLAIISDARLSSRADQAAIAERLLSISGEDAITVDRKHIMPWTGKLPTRFMLLSNELPRLSDTSGALASRFVLLLLENSWYGREDHNLTERLLTELPGILNWAVAGWQRLSERGHFAQPALAKEALEELEDLTSPVGAFVRDRCVVGQGHSVLVDHMFDAWKRWCESQGRGHPGTKATFGRDLRAAVPGLKVSQYRDAERNRERHYEGIALARVGTRV